jgi:hypothetical protein
MQRAVGQECGALCWVALGMRHCYAGKRRSKEEGRGGKGGGGGVRRGWLSGVCYCWYLLLSEEFGGSNLKFGGPNFFFGVS